MGSRALSPSAWSAFATQDVLLALAGAGLVEAGLFALAVAAGTSNAHIKPREEAPPASIPISVRPVLDDTPLLKLGGKVKTKLPDMWKKQAPVQRFQEQSAPSPQAKKTPDAIPTSALAKPDAGPPPPPDAEVAKVVDQVLTDAAPDAAPTVQGEGSPDGVKEGTETDPLKARAVSQYRAKLISWFNARFSPPTDIPCEELNKLSASVTVNVGGDRSVSGFAVGRPSGNELFDARVQSAMQGTVGAELPPPPPLYPDILGTSLSIRLARVEKCQ
jgi:hypothetical protein